MRLEGAVRFGPGLRAPCHSDYDALVESSRYARAIVGVCFLGCEPPFDAGALPLPAAISDTRRSLLARRVSAAAKEGLEFTAFSLAELEPIAYVHPCPLLAGGTDEQLNRMAR
jgi:hypothetical protein